jgi:hypothetical protein
LGWRFHRIWSTDWFYNRAEEIERAKVAYKTALSDDIELKGPKRITGDSSADFRELLGPRTRGSSSARSALFGNN